MFQSLIIILGMNEYTPGSDTNILRAPSLGKKYGVFDSQVLSLQSNAFDYQIAHLTTKFYVFNLTLAAGTTTQTGLLCPTYRPTTLTASTQRTRRLPRSSRVQPVSLWSSSTLGD